MQAISSEWTEPHFLSYNCEVNIVAEPSLRIFLNVLNSLATKTAMFLT